MRWTSSVRWCRSLLAASAQRSAWSCPRSFSLTPLPCASRRCLARVDSTPPPPMSSIFCFRACCRTASCRTAASKSTFSNAPPSSRRRSPNPPFSLRRSLSALATKAWWFCWLMYIFLRAASASTARASSSSFISPGSVCTSGRRTDLWKAVLMTCCSSSSDHANDVTSAANLAWLDTRSKYGLHISRTRTLSSASAPSPYAPVCLLQLAT
mmetsp:Transcript_9765/g.16767  ORF Transcript_9765/g.16767 Transcript_9765/m.16767 type:complete len:211 (-) Transcript_9765:1230-1862(-)